MFRFQQTEASIDLPEDTIFIILRKLASQDPLALLEAACACKAFHAVTARNPGLWKVAFYGAVLPVNEKPRDKALEAEVESFGGFKKLVKARWGKRTSGGRHSGSLSVGKDLHGGEPLGKSDSLILLCLVKTSNGRLLLGGAQKLRESSSEPDILESIVDGTRIRFPLRPVTMTENSDLAEICQPYLVNCPAVATGPAHLPLNLELYILSKAHGRAKMAPLFCLSSGNAHCYYPDQTRTPCGTTVCYSLAKQSSVALFKSTGRPHCIFNLLLGIYRKLSFYQIYVSPSIQQEAAAHLFRIVQAQVSRMCDRENFARDGRCPWNSTTSSLKN